MSSIASVPMLLTNVLATAQSRPVTTMSLITPDD
jgi:hypothetical protein